MMESELRDKLIVEGASSSSEPMKCQCCGEETHRLANLMAQRSDNGEYEEADVCDSCLLTIVFSDEQRRYGHWGLIERMKKKQQREL